MAEAWMYCWWVLDTLCVSDTGHNRDDGGCNIRHVCFFEKSLIVSLGNKGVFEHSQQKKRKTKSASWYR